MLHLTLLMLNLADQEKLEKAKTLMRALEPLLKREFFGVSEEECTTGTPKPVYLTFKGLATFQYLNPSQAKTIYVDLKKDENYDLLKKITSKIFKTFMYSQ